MQRTKKLKLNAPLRGLNAETIVTLRTDSHGTPLDSYWRRRLRDAEIDGCVEIVKETKAKKVTAETKKKGE